MPGRRFPFDPHATEKRCTKCGESKPLDAFSPDQKARDKRMSACKACRAASVASWRTNNPDRWAESRHNTYAKHRDQRREDFRQWRARHRDELKAFERARAEQRRAYHQQRMQDPAYRARRSEASREWRAKHPQRICDYSAQRRARIRQAPTVAPIDREAIAVRDGWTCHICGKLIRKGLAGQHPDALSLDHLVPLSQGGAHTADNLAAAHKRCNSRRGAGRLPAQLRLIG